MSNDKNIISKVFVSKYHFIGYAIVHYFSAVSDFKSQIPIGNGHTENILLDV